MDRNTIGNEIEAEINASYRYKNLRELIDILLSVIILKTGKKELVGIEERLYVSLGKIFDGETTINDIKLCLSNVIKIEPLLKKMILLIDEDEYDKIVQENLGLAHVITQLGLNPDNKKLDRKPEDYLGDGNYMEHIARSYALRNSESHTYVGWTRREIYTNLDSVLITCLRAVEINKKALKKVLQIGIPAGIQGAIFSISNVFIQSGINSFGEDAIAGSSLALNFEYFTYDIANAFAQAAVTFTSQNYGAANFKRCRKTFWLCMAFGIGFTEILSIVFMIWDDFFVSIYTISPAVAVYGLIRMRHVCSLEGLTATYEVESAALRGMGKSLEPAVFTILGTVVFRLIWLFTVFKWSPTYSMLMNVYVASWVFTGVSIFIIYIRHMKKVEQERV